MKAAMIGLAMLLSAMVVNAAEEPDTAAEASIKPMVENSLNQRICRYESQVGSHFRKRTCRTRRQWKQEDEENQADLRDVFRRLDPNDLSRE